MNFTRRYRLEREKKSVQSNALTGILLEAINSCKVDEPADKTAEAWELFLSKAKEQDLVTGEFEARSKERSVEKFL